MKLLVSGIPEPPETKGAVGRFSHQRPRQYAVTSKDQTDTNIESFVRAPLQCCKILKL